MTFEQERQFLNTSNFVNRLMSFGKELFTPVAKLNDASESEHETIWCALIPSDYDALKSDGWDLNLQGGLPGFLGYPPGETDYARFGREDGIEPLVFERLFYGLKPREIDISEEFRHYHNLWFDSKRNKYYKFSESGDEVEIIRCSEGSQVSIQTQAIKEFLAAKNMTLTLPQFNGQ
ncbi:MAG: hypothetical protein KIT34_13115 [Cyanobacteria bacterium TGS_CYA1]|nr:hypothetical protein [Cyanobacteria bacterium TGS_CYA1]